MEFLIVTGLSGAGKSKAIAMLEDIDFVCIDNMPPALLPAFGQIVLKSESDFRTAVVVDVRAGESFNSLSDSLDELTNMGVDYKILFIDCEDGPLINRFKETRRRHPLSKKYNNSLGDAIRAEREIMAPIKERADYVIDTTHLSSAQLKERIVGQFLGNCERGLFIHCMSFGFKHGIPADADIVYDVRCLPNPFYIPELEFKTGLDKEVADYVMQFETSQKLLDKIIDMTDFSLPLYAEEGKSELVIAFGCTGGHHRSVTFAEAMYKHLQEKGFKTTVIHRDITK